MSAPAPPASRRLVWMAVPVIAAAAAALYWWAPWTKPAAPSELVELDDSPLEPIRVANPGYLGPAVCAECHAKRVAEFQTTPHARAMRTAEPASMPPGFAPGKGRHNTHDRNLRFEMTRAGDDFLQTAIQLTPAGERRATSKIDLVFGANKADEVFFTWRDEKLYELTAVWLNPTNQWANSTYNPHGSGDFTRETTTRCLECHNTWFEHVPGTTNQYRRDNFILGTTCERCHGPGREHVEFHRAHPKTDEPHAVIRPGLLARERLIEVCTQCHGNSTKPRGPMFSYRPGEPLENHFRTAVTTHPEQDHVANQVKYLRQSKCFQKSDSMTCITCHDPHRPHAPSEAGSADKACFKCHQPENCKDRPRLPAAVRDKCIECHMPQQVWMNVHFHTDTDQYVPPIRRFQHRIGIHQTARSEVLLAWHRTQTGDASRREADRLSGELVEHWLGEVGSRRKDYRFLAAVGAAREALRSDPAPPARTRAVDALRALVATQAKLDADLVEALHQIDQGRLPQAIDTLIRILEVKPNWAVVHGKLGTLYAATGQFDRAIPHLEAVARHDPDDQSGFAMLGWLAYLQERPAEAIEFYRKADEIEPHAAKINYHWGLALVKLGRWPDAADRFRRTVAIDPNHAGALQGLSHALREIGQPADAIAPALRAAKLTGFAQADVLVALAEAYAAAGQVAEARAAAAKALAADTAQPGGPALGFDIRRRMETIRAVNRP